MWGDKSWTRSLQSSPFWNPGGVPWAWRSSSSSRTVLPRSNIGLVNKSTNLGKKNSKNRKKSLYFNKQNKKKEKNVTGKKCYPLSFPILGGCDLIRALQSSQFQNPGGVPWAWWSSSSRRPVLPRSNIGLVNKSKNFEEKNSKKSQYFKKLNKKKKKKCYQKKMLFS